MVLQVLVLKELKQQLEILQMPLLVLLVLVKELHKGLNVLDAEILVQDIVMDALDVLELVLVALENVRVSV